MDTILSMVPSSCKEKLGLLCTMDCFSSLKSKADTETSVIEEVVRGVLSDDEGSLGDTMLEQLNVLRAEASRDSNRLLSHWDKLHPSVRSWVDAHVTPLLRDFETKYRIRPRWDHTRFSTVIGNMVLMYVISQVYFGERENNFFEDCVDILLKGTCPCGYDGKYPIGRFIVA